MKRAIVLLVALAAVQGARADEIHGVGTLRADYSSFLNFEINAELNALPFLDIEIGYAPFVGSNFAHGAIGPRIDILSRTGDAGFSVKLVALASAWFATGGNVVLHGFSVNPGVSATLWVARRFGFTGSITVPVFIPTGMGAITTVSAFPRFGLGFSF